MTEAKSGVGATGASGWSATGIPGAWRRRVTFHADTRGAFGEVWRGSWDAELPADPHRTPIVVAQANLSRSQPRVLRGLHLHRRQVDVWVLLDGRAFIALVDLRDAAAGTGPVTKQTFELDTGDVLLIPEGVAHAFYARDAISLLYAVTNEYNNTDELGFAWNDPDAAIAWPDADPILSARDATAPSLAEAIAALRAAAQQSDDR